MNFASDNTAPVAPEILAAIARANEGFALGYGNDAGTARVKRRFCEIFEREVEVFLVPTGTGANALAIAHLSPPWGAVMCHEEAHIAVDECGAPERFTGCKLLPLSTPDGKLRASQMGPLLHDVGFEHHVQPRVISISQATEMGTVYTPREVKALSTFAHDNGMLLHMDGARIANAAASLGLKLRAITKDAGVDILSFGGAKNGMMYGEAVVFFDQKLARDFKYTRKQGMHLPSKMRFISAQFEALLSNDLWRQNAEHANRMAQLLASELGKIPQVRITQKVEANGVFAEVPKKYIPVLQKRYFFYVWNEETSEARFMTSFDTTESDIQDFILLLKKTIK